MGYQCSRQAAGLLKISYLTSADSGFGAWIIDESVTATCVYASVNDVKVVMCLADAACQLTIIRSTLVN
jgi:hypothetical protein